jgi:hypothetical protein
MSDERAQEAQPFRQLLSHGVLPAGRSGAR